MEPSSETDTTTTVSKDESLHDTPKKESMIAEIIRFSLVALIIVLPIRIFIAQPFIVSGTSMEHTFSNRQYLIIDQISYRFHEPKRGDVIVFRYPKDTTKFFIKRIIGLPGDTISINGKEVRIINTEHPEGVTLTEPYILSMHAGTTLTEKLGKGEYFVMGDNRDASSDSRAWGVLPRENIVGRTFLRLFPFTVLGTFPGAYDIDVHAGL